MTGLEEIFPSGQKTSISDFPAGVSFPDRVFDTVELIQSSRAA